jgi:hypothetical protein
MDPTGIGTRMATPSNFPARPLLPGLPFVTAVVAGHEYPQPGQALAQVVGGTLMPVSTCGNLSRRKTPEKHYLK